MAWKRFYVAAGLTSVVFGLTGCRWWHHAHPQGTSGPAGTGTVLREPVVPAGYKKIAPLPADSSAGILSQTSTVFRGSLKEVAFTYDDCGGPRTTYVFSNASPLVGETVSSTLNVKALGGPTPRGTWLSVSELPKLALDSEYVVFLRNTDWTFSPIVGDLAFRVEKIGGRELLVHPSGRVLTGWDSDGPVLSAGAVSEPVGSAARGYVTATTPPRGGVGTTGRPETNGQVTPGTKGQAPPPATPRTGGSVLTGAPTFEQVRQSGIFARPKLLEVNPPNEPMVTADAIAALLKQAAEKANVKIGGRVTLDPYWRCWNATPTLRARR